MSGKIGENIRLFSPIFFSDLDYLTALSSSQSRLTSIPKPGASDGLTYPFFMTGVPGRETISSSGTPGGDTPSDRSPHGITGIA